MFKQSITLSFLVTRTKVINNLKSKTDSWHSDGSKNPFEGKINDEGTFEIYPTFDYNARNQLRPKIRGEVCENSIQLTFEAPKNMVILIALSCLASIAASIISYIKDLEIKWFLFLIAPILFCLIAYKIYSNKVTESLKIIKNAIQ
jgi:hypothetical protein